MAQIQKNGDKVLVDGDMTVECVHALLAESASILDGGDLEFDLAGVSDVDSASLSLIFEWLRQAHSHNASIVFANLPANLVSLATLYGVLDLIPQHTH